MTWLESAWDLLLQSAVASLGIGAVAAVAVLCCRQPVRRIRIIESALVACLAAPWLSLAPGYPRWRPAWPAGAVEPVAGLRPADVDASDRSSRPAAPDEPDRAFAPGLSREELSEAFDERPARWRVESVAGGCYLIVAGGMTAWWFLGLAAWLRLLGNSQPAPERVQERWRKIAGPEGGLSRVVVSARVSQPVTFTALRPVVVLPAELCQEDDGRALDWCLRHEWSHASRGDAWSWSFATLTRALFWYQPLVWWLRGQLRLNQDFVADSAAARQSVSVEDYAEYLTSRMAMSRRVPSWAGLSIVGPASDLSRRVVMLIESDRPLEAGCPRRWSVGVALATVLVVALTATVALRPAASSGEDAEVAGAPVSPPGTERAAAQPTAPAVDQDIFGGAVDANGKDLADLAREGYSRNREAFREFKCRFRVTEGTARTVDAALAGAVEVSMTKSGLWYVSGEDERHELHCDQPTVVGPLKPVAEDLNRQDGGEALSAISEVNCLSEASLYHAKAALSLRYSPFLRAVNLRESAPGLDTSVTLFSMGIMGRNESLTPARLVADARGGKGTLRLEQSQVIDGKMTTVLLTTLPAMVDGESAYSYRWFLDGAQGYLPLKVELSQDDKWRGEMHLTKVRSCENGHYFPDRNVCVWRRGDDKVSVVIMEVTEFDLTCPTPDELSLELPAGVAVSNVRSPLTSFKLAAAERVGPHDLEKWRVRGEEAFARNRAR